MRIILATHNLHKRDELAAILGDRFQIEILPDDFPDIEETGATLEENAYIKARVVFDALHIPSLADDTGLAVEALNGAPGVYTARYAGEHATYADNCDKLIRELFGKDNRDATFSTVLCYIGDNGAEHYFRGDLFGRISEAGRGSNGFGYDPVFEPGDHSGKTLAELSADEKNAISHRSRAVAAFMNWAAENLK